MFFKIINGFSLSYKNWHMYYNCTKPTYTRSRLIVGIETAV